MLALQSDVDRRGLQRRQRHRDEPERPGRGAAQGDGLEPAARVRPRAQGQPGAAAPGRHDARPRAMLGFRAAGRPRGRPARAWSSGGSARASWPCMSHARMIPIAKPVHGRGARPRPRAASSSAAGSRRGPRWRRSSASSPRTSARRTPAPSRTARRRCTWRCSPSASGRATRSSPSAIRSSPPPTPSATAARRRCSSTSSRDTYNIDPALIEPAITRAHAGDPVRPPDRACRATSRAIVRDRASGTACRVIEDAACAIGSEILWDGEWEKIGRPHGDVACFSFHPRKVITTGDGGMLTTAQRRLGSRSSGCCASTR